MLINNFFGVINNITIDAKSGYSGAGKNLEKKFTHKNLFNSTFASTNRIMWISNEISFTEEP